MTTESDLCRGCEEPALEGQLYHPGCCPHEHVDSQDNGSGDGREAPIHDWESRCLDCGEELIPDGEGGWDSL